MTARKKAQVMAPTSGQRRAIDDDVDDDGHSGGKVVEGRKDLITVITACKIVPVFRQAIDTMQASCSLRSSRSSSLLLLLLTLCICMSPRISFAVARPPVKRNGSSATRIRLYARFSPVRRRESVSGRWKSETKDGGDKKCGCLRCDRSAAIMFVRPIPGTGRMDIALEQSSVHTLTRLIAHVLSRARGREEERGISSTKYSLARKSNACYNRSLARCRMPRNTRNLAIHLVGTRGFVPEGAIRPLVSPRN